MDEQVKDQLERNRREIVTIAERMFFRFKVEDWEGARGCLADIGSLSSEIQGALPESQEGGTAC